MRWYFPSVCEVEAFHVDFLKCLFHLHEWVFILVWDDIHHSLVNILQCLLWFSRRLWPFFSLLIPFLRLFFLLRILDCLWLFLWCWLLKSSQGVAQSEGHQELSIVVEVILRCHYFLYLISGCCVQINVLRLKILEGIFRHNWSLKGCGLHGWL